MSLLHIGGSSGTSVVPAEGVDFDGTYDLLSRSTDLVGNVDSKTFTFSCWVYRNTSSWAHMYRSKSVSYNTYIRISSAGAFQAYMVNSVGTVMLQADVAVTSSNTFLNILISVDLANTANRSIYINDIAQTVVWTTYINGTIDFTVPTHLLSDDSVPLKGRLAHVYLDYTYRDLSIEANRRLFITADGKPTPTATLKALNSILYLPMKDSATAHINEGTGGNFTANGTFATSNRGANQDNCVASYFDGTADYLSRTSLTGVADGKQFTFSCTFKAGATTTLPIISMDAGTSTTSSQGFSVYIETVYNKAVIIARNSSGTTIFQALCDVAQSIVVGATNTLTLSIDLADTNKRAIFINGSQIATIWSTYINDSINLTTTKYVIGTRLATTPFFNGNIGELYFDTVYRDLLVSNPFYDSDTKTPIPVRKAMATLGSSPLICMPLDASNAGKNYGTGGDFTANSAPYVGARGASEFWARSIYWSSTANYLSRATALIGVTNSYTASLSFSFFSPSTNNGTTILAFNGISGIKFYLVTSSIYIVGNGIEPSNVGTFTHAKWNTVNISIDKLNQANSKMYINGVSIAITWVVFNTLVLSLNTSPVSIFGGSGSNGTVGTLLSSLYFTTDYIDFSQEVNRLKFVDGLGYPLDLGKQIEAGVIPKPLIYLPFDDPTNLGKNLGTGGDFSVVGTVTTGADFSL